MWQADSAQKLRIADSLKTLKQVIEAHWTALELSQSSDKELANDEEKKRKFHAIRAELAAKWSGDELGDRIAEVWLFPCERGVHEKMWTDPKPVQELRRAIETLCRNLKAIAPSRYAMELLCARIRLMLANPVFDGERNEGLNANYNFYDPRLGACFDVIAETKGAHSMTLIEDIVSGRANTTEFKRPESASSNPERYESAYQALSHDVSSAIRRFWLILDAIGKFDYATFRTSCNVLRDVVPWAVWGLGDFEYVHLRPSQPLQGFDGKVAEYAKALAWEWAEDFDANVRRLMVFNAFGGARFLLFACKQIEARPQLKKLNKTQTYDGKQPYENILGRMAKISCFEDGDDKAAVFEALKKFSPRTLKLVQAVGGVGQPLVNAALAELTGEKDMTPLFKLIAEINKSFKAELNITELNSADPTKGVLEQEGTRKILKQYSEKELREALKQVQLSDKEAKAATMLLQAIMGWNEEEIAKGWTKRVQIAVRAYGLLPLPDGRHGRKECLKRYLALRQFAKESNEFGQERRANERAAAEAGLANLAGTAGFGDVTRLEWAMEAMLADEAKAPTEVKVKNYTARLGEEDGTPKVLIEKDGKALKTAPDELKKNESFKELQELAKVLKTQRTRFKAALERLCAEGAAIHHEDLKGIGKLPVARALAERIIFRTDTGKFGLYDAGAHALSGAGDAGKKPSIELEGELTVAHPLDLFEAGALAAWQKEIVSRQIVQPFKQAFRELYVLTPAERETRVFSNRFAGHTLITRSLSGLLSTRGWKSAGSDGVEITRLYPKAGLKAELNITDGGHYLTEIEVVMSDSVVFRNYPEQTTWQAGVDHRVPLEKVGAKIFSEVMRDVDLFISVSRRSDDNNIYMSSEAYVKRGELLRSVLAELGLPGVNVEGHFAHVKGKLANYRVHLATAAIHIEPGNYLCVVPDKAAKKKDLYLPFADDDDPKLSEVVSKVILLVNDDKIKDESILSQIKRK